MATAATMAPLQAQFAQISLSNPVTTPADYVTHAFEIPKERYVGLLACQLDPNLRELETVVTRCTKKTQAAVSRSNGKEKGKQQKGSNGSGKATPKQEEELWEVELLDTPLFPEGGGQASDSGSLSIYDAGNSDQQSPIIVREVVRRHLAAVHMCTAPVEPGTRVLARVDWTRRHDLCTQHTAQHLLSAVLEHHFKLETLGWALSSFPNLSYVELPRCPTRGELQEAERLCNALIVEGRRVRVEMALSQDENRPDTLPADYIGGVVRTVIIDDLDRNPCCGTHYHSLAPLQALHVSATTSPVRGTNTRVYFLAGPRIGAQLTSSIATLKSAASELSCSADDVPARAKIALDSLRDTTRREKRVREELAEFVAHKAVTQARKDAGDAEMLVGALVREEDGTNDLEFLTIVQFKIRELLGETAKYAFALAQVGNSTAAPDGCLLLFASDDAIVSRMAAALKKGETAFGARLKGGGKGRWQGKLTEGKFHKERDEPILLELLRRAVDA